MQYTYRFLGLLRYRTANSIAAAKTSRDTPYRIRSFADAAEDVLPVLPGKLPIDGLPLELPLPPFCAFSSVCWVLSEAS